MIRDSLFGINSLFKYVKNWFYFLENLFIIVLAYYTYSNTIQEAKNAFRTRASVLSLKQEGGMVVSLTMVNNFLTNMGATKFRDSGTHEPK